MKDITVTPTQNWLYKPGKSLATPPTPVTPKNGTDYNWREVAKLLDCQTVECVELNDEFLFLIDEEGKLTSDWQQHINYAASEIWYQFNPAARGVDVLVGKCLLVHTSNFL